MAGRPATGAGTDRLACDRRPHRRPPAEARLVYWERESVLLTSRLKPAKIDHIRRNPRVALHFDGDGFGGDIVVLLGQAGLDAEAATAGDPPSLSRQVR